MIKNKKVLAIITARGGSKSIPHKNIVDVNGRPLIAYVIKAALNSRLVDEVVVSTDDYKIKKVAEQCGAKVPFIRPKKLASDTAKSIDVLIHGLKEMEKQNKNRYDYVICLQPTNPFLSGQDIDQSIILAEKNKADSVTSVYELTDFHPAKLKIIKNGLLKDFQYKEKEGTRRQDYPKLYKRNGGLYLTKRSVLLKNSLFGKKTVPYVMPPEKSVDINDKIDLALAKLLLKETT